MVIYRIAIADRKMHESDKNLKQELNNQTGKLTWPELERYFARGVVLTVKEGVDLVDVAICFVEYDAEAVERWKSADKLSQATIEDAQRWVASDPLFWGIVVAPWVLVQEISATQESSK